MDGGTAVSDFIREIKTTMDTWNTVSHLVAACRMLSIGSHFAAGINCAKAREYTREIDDPIVRGRARDLCAAMHDVGYIEGVKQAGDAVRRRELLAQVARARFERVMVVSLGMQKVDDAKE